MVSVQSVCSQGIHAYLAEQHNSFRKEKLSKGLIVGGLTTGLLIGINQGLKLDIPMPYLFVPLLMIGAVSAGEGLMLQNAEDLDHKEAFDFMCKEKEGEDHIKVFEEEKD